MRTRNAVTRLAAVSPQVESLVDDAEVDRILERILAAPRQPTVRRRPLALALAGVALLAAAAVVGSLELGRSSPAASQTAGHHHQALSGARIQLAGYRFRTPAGFSPSADTCQFWMPAGQQPGTPIPVLHSFALAGAADGGCLEALLIDGVSVIPSDATPVAVGSYSGFVALRSSQEALYVEIPAATGDHFLVLLAQGLTTQQLVAIAQSGLPSGTAIPAPPCTEDCG